MQAARQPLLRPGLLDGQVVGVAGRTGGLGRAAAGACGALGAHVEQVGDEGHRVDLADEAGVRAALAAIAAPERALHTVVVDAASAFAPGSGSGADALRAAMAVAWTVARAAAAEVMIEAPEGGRLVFLAPSAGAGRYAGALRAALENLARTLSIEWSRYAIRTATVAPGRHSRASEVADMVAYLASPAGAYFSGCVLDLDGARA
jgi:citronellol/citronellal dehydrogenase